MESGVFAIVYAALLCAGARLFARADEPLADRLRTVAVLAIAIPGLLGLCDLLYPAAVWALAAGLAAWGLARRGVGLRLDRWALATVGACALVAWPALSRPLLGGDTFLYHLPNAVAFVQHHGIWTAAAPYWVYPAGSELAAAGLWSVSGRWALTLTGILPGLLIAARLYQLAVDRGAGRAAAGTVALAFIAMPLAAFQLGTLESDLWLAAFFLEALTAADAASLAIAALVKPFGFVESAIAACAGRAPLRRAAVASVPVAIWAIRDIALRAHGAPLGFRTPPYWMTTIAGNGTTALVQLLHGIARTTPQSCFFLAWIAVGWWIPKTRNVAVAGTAVLALYAILPFSYTSGTTNYAVDASSFRFALGALVAGAAVAAMLCAHLRSYAVVLFGAVAAWGVVAVLAVFWNDGVAHVALPAALVAVAAALAAARTRGIAPIAIACALVLIGSRLQATRAAGFLGEYLREPSGAPTHFFAWIARTQPRAAVVENLRVGSILLASPSTRVQVAPEVGGCAAARRARALLVVGSDEDASAAGVRAAFARGRRCGEVVYEDGSAIAVRPK